MLSQQPLWNVIRGFTLVKLGATSWAVALVPLRLSVRGPNAKKSVNCSVAPAYSGWAPAARINAANTRKIALLTIVAPPADERPGRRFPSAQDRDRRNSERPVWST